MNSGGRRAGAVLEISLNAIVENWRRLRDRARPAECAAVVKADAYGLGAAQVAPALLAAGCRRPVSRIIATQRFFWRSRTDERAHRVR